MPRSQLWGGSWAHEQRDELVANQSEAAPELCGTGGRSLSVTVLWAATTQQPPCPAPQVLGLAGGVRSSRLPTQAYPRSSGNNWPGSPAASPGRLPGPRQAGADILPGGPGPGNHLLRVEWGAASWALRAGAICCVAPLTACPTSILPSTLHHRTEPQSTLKDMGHAASVGSFYLRVSAGNSRAPVPRGLRVGVRAGPAVPHTHPPPGPESHEPNPPLALGHLLVTER